MSVTELLLDFLTGRHTVGQMQNLFKYFFNSKNYIVSWDPIYISIFLTYNCNLRCDMCLTHSTKFDNPFGQKPSKDIDFDLFKQILNRYKNALAVRLTGNGDPLLHKDLFKMIEYASNIMKMDVSSSSNGILVEDFIDEILSSSLKTFNISLNGHNSQEFNRMTGMKPELFDKICNNTIKLTERKKQTGSNVKITASLILDQYNYKYLPEMIYFVNDLNVDAIMFYHFLPCGSKGFMSEDRCLFSDDLNVLTIFDKVKSLPSNIKKKVVLPPLLDRDMKNNRYCPVWFHNISIDGDGNAGGCCCQILDLTQTGNFNDKNVWNNLQFQEMRRRFLDPTFPILDPCTWCYQNSSYKHNWLSIKESLYKKISQSHHR